MDVSQPQPLPPPIVAAAQAAGKPYKRREWQPGDPCGACGSTDTHGYAGNASCRTCHAHDQDGG